MTDAISAYVVDTAAATLGCAWYVDGSTVEGDTAYEFHHVRITATGVESETLYYDETVAAQQADVADIVAAEPGALPRVLVALDAIYRAPSLPDVVRHVFAYEVRLASPYGPTILSPEDVSTGDTAAGVEVQAVFASPVPGDRVTGWTARWTVNEGATWTTAPRVDTPDDAQVQTLAVFAGGTFADATTVMYQVAWFGVDGALSPWSPTRQATFYDPPAAPTIVAPVEGFVDYRTVVALADAPGREEWQIQRCADDDGAPGEVLFDTGARLQVGPVAEPIIFPTPGGVEWVLARQAMHGLWSLWTAVQVSPQYSLPPAPIVGVEANQGALAIDIQILVPAVGPGEIAPDHCVARARRVGAEAVEWQARAPLNGVARFATPASCVAYEVQVDSVALAGPVSQTGWVR